MHSRFRMPVVPLLAVFAMGGAAWLVEAARANRRRALALATAGIAAVTFACLREPANQDRTLHRAVNFQNLGVLHARIGQYPEAIDAYRESVHLGNAQATCDLAIVTFKNGVDARDALNDCVRTNPEHADAWLYLGRVHEAAGKRAAARDAYALARALR